LILVVLFIASSVAVATPLARKVFVSTGAVLSLVVGKLLRRPPGKHPATPARTADPVSSPRLIQLKRWRRWSWILLWCSAILVLGDPAFGGVLATALMIVLSLTVTIRRESRPLRTPVLNDIARPSPDSGRLKHKRRRWRISVAATIVGFVAVATCRAAFFPRESSAFWDATDSLMWITFLTAFGVSVAGSVKHGRIVERDERKRRSKVLEWQDVADAEFVLYLRSFADDVATSRFMAGGLTAEEHFARILNQVGPLVAVGSPGEEQPELGAYRLYLDQSEWQESVAILMGRAKLVVIRTGLSDGLSWEIERAVGLVEPQRLLIVVDDADEMRRCLSWMRTVHPQVSSNVKLGYRRACGIRGLLVFDENWRVTALRMRGMGWYRHRSGNIVDPGLARSMYPVFQTLGVEWPPPRIAVVRSLLLALALWVVIGLVFDLMASLQS
jgi:hypothetical protein